MKRQIRRLMVLSVGVLPAIIPSSCAEPILRELTPFLIDGSNDFMVELINFAAPLVLP